MYVPSLLPFSLALAALVIVPTLPANAGVSLTAPKKVPVGSSFEVSFSPPESKGRINITAEDGSPLKKAASYGYTNAKKPSVTLTAPLQPSTYGINFRAQGKDPEGLVTFETTPVSASLTAPDSASIGEEVEISFTGPCYQKDLLSFGDKDGNRIKGSSYTYPGSAKTPTVKLRAPMDPGSYTILYLMSDVVLAKSGIRIGGASAELSASATVQAGGGLDVFWQGPDNKGDFITLHDTNGKRVSGHAYTGNSKEGAVRLEVPEQTGNYEIIYVSGGKTLGNRPVEIIPISATLNAPAEVTAGLQFEVKWDGPGNRQDQIVMLKPEENDDVIPITYTYLDPTNPLATLGAPDDAGDYTLRYRIKNGTVLASVPIKVIPAPQNPGILLVLADTTAGFGNGSAVEVILDASGSMLQKQGGKRRIDIAKDTLVSLITDTIPAKTPFALRVFGHKEADSCRTDLEVPLSPLDPAALVATINRIEAKNLAKTPIAASLTSVASDLREVPGECTVILLTDGEETCGGDPALAIRKLRADGMDVRINIVGYAIDDENLRQTFESWAALGNGRFLNAPGADELSAAMKQALAPPYRIYRDEKLVATGIAGESKHELPAGDYTLRYQSAGETLSTPLTIRPEKTTEATIP